MSKDKKSHLPVFGIGPFYVIGIIFITIIGITLSEKGEFASGKIYYLKNLLMIAGILLIILGIAIWIAAAVFAKIDNNIIDNKLVTTGIYSYVRNPLYSSFMFVCTGAILIENNLWLWILPFIYWLAMTLLIKNTEEKWLENLYGQEYVYYCKKVNRCIPWIKR